MLIYTYKLEQYILHKILPKILIGPRYKLKGSFKRKVPYVRDIDIVNYVFPETNKSNVKDAIIKLIASLEEQDNIKLLYVTCGVDDRFQLNIDSRVEIDKLKKLLKEDEIEEVDRIVKKYQNEPEKKLFYINEEFRNCYKLRWEPKCIIQNKLKRRGGVEFTFDSVIDNNCSLTLKYYINIKSIPIGFDVAVYYEKVNCVGMYENETKRTLKVSNYQKDYYYMLFPFRYYFRDNKKITAELANRIEQKFGLYKQIMVRIETFKMLFDTKNLDIKMATNIVTSIIQSIEANIPAVAKSNTINMIKKTASNNTPKTKINEWNIQLQVLKDELLQIANAGSKEYYFKLLELVQ